MKKSQLELFGLAIVVVIVIVAVLFLLVYFGSKKPSEARKSYVQSELASSMINTLINIDFEYVDSAAPANNCAKIKMAEIIRFCGLRQASNYICRGKDACMVAEEAARTIFGSTIDPWTASTGTKKNYYFSVYTSAPDNPSIKLGDKCKGDKKFKEYIIPTNLHVNLEICS